MISRATTFVSTAVFQMVLACPLSQFFLPISPTEYLLGISVTVPVIVLCSFFCFFYSYESFSLSSNSGGIRKAGKVTHWLHPVLLCQYFWYIRCSTFSMLIILIITLDKLYSPSPKIFVFWIIFIKVI